MRGHGLGAIDFAIASDVATRFGRVTRAVVGARALGGSGERNAPRAPADDIPPITVQLERGGRVARTLSRAATQDRLYTFRMAPWSKL